LESGNQEGEDGEKDVNLIFYCCLAPIFVFAQLVF